MSKSVSSSLSRDVGDDGCSFPEHQPFGHESDGFFLGDAGSPNDTLVNIIRHQLSAMSTIEEESQKLGWIQDEIHRTRQAIETAERESECVREQLILEEVRDQKVLEDAMMFWNQQIMELKTKNETLWRELAW